MAPLFDGVFTEPDNKASPLERGVVILLPVSETVGEFGSFVFHTPLLETERAARLTQELADFLA